MYIFMYINLYIYIIVVTPVENGKLALEELRKEDSNIDIVLLDI